MPAGRGNQCERCYFEGLVDKRTKFNTVAFRNPTMAWHFMKFEIWLKATSGPERAAQKVHRFLPFFLEVESEWDRIPEYGELLEHFGARKLRSVLLAVYWMEESGLVKPDAGEHMADSDRRRIEATIGRFPPGSQTRMVIETYHEVIDERLRAGCSTTRSIRLALAPAAGRSRPPSSADARRRTRSSSMRTFGRRLGNGRWRPGSSRIFASDTEPKSRCHGGTPGGAVGSSRRRWLS